MSLSKQLLILLSALFLMIFAVNFVLSVNNIRSYLEGEAEIHAQDTATSLGVSLSPYMSNESDPIIETTMNAIFDRGYYQEIRLQNVDGETLIILNHQPDIEGVPEWFVDYFPMQVSTAQSEITSGWNISGMVQVTINPGYAYLKLYDQVKQSFFYSLMTFVISFLLLTLVLQMTLSSLKRVEKMANTLSKGVFETIDPLPWTTEIRSVVKSLNMMSGKIEETISKLNQKLSRTGLKLQQDELTGLNKRSTFETDLKQLFSEDHEAYLFLIKIDGLTDLVKELGNHSIDQFLLNFSQALKNVSEQFAVGKFSLYRLLGSEFVMLVQQIDLEQAEQLAKMLSDEISKLGERYEKADIAHIGIVPFNPLSDVEGMVLAANEAYEQAHLIGKNSYFIRTNEDQAKDIAEWKALVFNVIDNQQYDLKYVGQVEELKGGQLIMEEAFLSVNDQNGQNVATGTFVSIAEKYAKIVELDQGVVESVVAYINQTAIKHAVAINLSTRTIKNSGFRIWLNEILADNQAIAHQLVFSLSAYAVAKEIAVYKEFVDFVQGLNAKAMVKRFHTQTLSPEGSKYLKPDFIRLARDLGHDISSDTEKRTFVETIHHVASLMDISILAENVQSEADFNCFKEIGISGVNR